MKSAEGEEEEEDAEEEEDEDFLEGEDGGACARSGRAKQLQSTARERANAPLVPLLPLVPLTFIEIFSSPSSILSPAISSQPN
jgi:hypothetical protein